MAKRPASSKSSSSSPRRKQTGDERPSIAAKERTPVLDPTLQRRVVVEAVRPQVDSGRFPIKRVPGERVTVTADIFADGHDELGAVVLYRKVGDADWREAPMTLVTNDRWQATFDVEAIGAYEYTVEGWIDRFATWRRDLIKKAEA